MILVEAVDVYGHDDSQRQMAMQPRAGSNFDFQSKHGFFRGNVARVKYFAKKMLQIVTKICEFSLSRYT